MASRPLRSVAAGPAAIATVLVALTAGFGGTPASAAALHAGAKAAHVAPAWPAADRGGARRSAVAVSGATWHTLSLLNGWRSEQGTYDSGNPSWAVKGGMVYLSGALHQPAGSGPVFAVLPPAARPASVQALDVYTQSGATGLLVIAPTGKMVALLNVHDDYTSLAGVSFPAAATPLHRLTMLNGWQHDHGGGLGGNPAYTVIGGVVHLSGTMLQPVGTGTSDVFAVLPPAARPARVLYLTVFKGSNGVLRISPDGMMHAYQGGASSSFITSLGGVSFPAAATAGHRLSLLNSWASMQSVYNSGDPAYTVTGGVVYLSGSMHQTAGSNQVFAVLPPAARPSHNLWIRTYTVGGSVGALLITPSGIMETYNDFGNAAQAYTSLAGIAYPLGS